MYRTSSLTQDTAPLDRRRATHLLRRATLGPTPDRVDALLGRTPSEAVDALLAEAAATPLPPDPSWVNAEYPEDGGEAAEEAFFDQNLEEWLPVVQGTWLDECIAEGLRPRMTLFWHNHFVTGWEKYELAPVAHRYVQTLRRHAIGHFPSFVEAIGTEPAMLFYLDGIENLADAPNENYARELLELFTMGRLDQQGQPNYTEQDIAEMARALTGWIVGDEYRAFFEEDAWDSGTKTFLGRTGRFNHTDVVRILFETRAPQIAYFIAGKLYQEFVYEQPDAAVVQALADVMLQNNFQIAAVLRALLTSTHFFDPRFHGARIKSPVELLSGYFRALGLSSAVGLQREVVGAMGDDLEQWLLEPPNVAGWPGYRNWLGASSLPTRWQLMEYLTEVLIEGGETEEGDVPSSVDPLALFDRFGGGEGDAFFAFPVRLAEHLLPVPLADASIVGNSAPFAGNLSRFPIPTAVQQGPAYVRDLAKQLLRGTPWYEATRDPDQLFGLVMDYVLYLIGLPEFQLT
ncbi:MAG: DUF1800 domain-containing protein [Bacteroidota bacterium]